MPCRSPWSVSLLGLVVLFASGCQRSTAVVVTATDVPAEASALLVSGSLEGRAFMSERFADPRAPFSLSLPAETRGVLRIDVSAQGAAELARGTGQVTLAGEARHDLQIPLQRTGLPKDDERCPNPAAPRWCWESPWPQGAHLRATWAFSADDVWAVGDRGAVLHFDGAAWRRLTGADFDDIFGVWGAAPDDVWFASDEGRVFRSRDGKTLEAGPYLKVDMSDTPPRLHSVFGSNKDDIWFTTYGRHILHTTDQGRNYKIYTNENANISEALWTDGKEVFVAAETIEGMATAGEVWQLMGGKFQTVYKSAAVRFGGVFGTAKEIFVTQTDGAVLRGDRTKTPVSFAPEMTGFGSSLGRPWAIGDTLYAPSCCGNILRRSAGAWSTLKTLPTRMLAVSGVDAGRAFAVGEGGAITALSEGAFKSVFPGEETERLTWDLGAIFGTGDKSLWAGGPYTLRKDEAGWKKVQRSEVVAGGRSIEGMWGSGDKDIFAVGVRGLALRYDGAQWNRVEGAKAETDLLDVFGLGQEVWAVGTLRSPQPQRGEIYRYDRGTGRFVLEEALTVESELHGLWGASPDDLWAVGGHPREDKPLVFRKQGGKWTQETRYPGKHRVYTVWGRGAQDVWFAGSLDADGLFTHYDAGTWREVPTGLWYGAIYHMNGLPGGVAAAVGRGGDIAMLNGREWSKAQSGTFASLNSVAVVGKTLYVAGAAGNILRLRE